MAKRKHINMVDVERRLSDGESLRSIAKSIGYTYQTLQYHRRRLGYSLLREARSSGKEHASWKGGSFIDRFGYRMVLSPERGMANKYVAEHVLIAEKILGRRIRKGVEVVHHINCDHLDNRPENLLVVTKSEHMKLHFQLEQLARKLLSDHIIVFIDGVYTLTM